MFLVMQLSGVGLIVVALALISQKLAKEPAHVAAISDVIGSVVGLAVAAALQAVDGIALQAMVTAWNNAPKPEKDMPFYSAFAVR